MFLYVYQNIRKNKKVNLNNKKGMSVSLLKQNSGNKKVKLLTEITLDRV